MLSRVRTVRLCHGCQWDLQLLFERGFCTTRPAFKSSLVRPQWRNRRVNLQHPSRPFSASVLKLQRDDNSEKPIDDSSAAAELKPSNHAYTRLEKLADLERKLDDLHRKLYYSLQEAVNDIQPPETLDPTQPLSLKMPATSWFDEHSI